MITTIIIIYVYAIVKCVQRIVSVEIQRFKYIYMTKHREFLQSITYALQIKSNFLTQLPLYNVNL